MNLQLTPNQHVHIIGIGGFGMSAIAQVLLKTGYIVSGSDQKENQLTTTLTEQGATIFIGHDAANINNADVILASSAIPQTNPELQAAAQKNIPVLNRRASIGAITANYRTIAVSGTHGKTTTTALMSHVLATAGLDPTTIVGGVMNDVGTNARVGKVIFL